MGMGWDWQFPASLMKPGVVGGVSKWLPPSSQFSHTFYSSPLGYERERGFFFTYDDHDDLSLLFFFWNFKWGMIFEVC